MIRNLQKHYRKLIRSYKVDDLDIKNNQEDKEIYEEFLEVTDAYEQIMKEFGVDESDEKIFGIIPQDYFSEQRRSKWSRDEGYVPFTKRELNGYEEHRPCFINFFTSDLNCRRLLLFLLKLNTFYN